MKLNTLGIDALAFSDKQRTIFDDQLPGFGVRVGKHTKTFVLLVGRERKIHSIGRYPALSLKNARTAALRLLADRDTTKHQKPRTRFLEAVDAFMTEKRAQTRHETLRQYDRTLSIYLKAIHHKFIEDVTTADITNVTDRLLKEGKGPSANHALVASKTFLKWCVKRRLIPHSPAEGLDRPAREVERERVLLDDELRAVWRAADATPAPFGIIVKLLILTGQRRGEIGSLKAEWCSLPSSKDGGPKSSRTLAPLAVGGENTDCEVSAGFRKCGTRAECTITLPSSVTKNAREHRLPIGAFCADILTKAMTTLPPVSGYIFSETTNGFNGWSKLKREIDKRAKIAPWKIHDIRRSYVTNLQRIGVRLEVIENLVNHRGGTRSGVAGVYARHSFWPEMVAAVTEFDSWFQSTILSRNK